MGFVWVHADPFLRCVASPFNSVVITAVTVHATGGRTHRGMSRTLVEGS